MAREAAPPRRSARESRAIKYLNSPTPEPEPVKLQSSLDKGPPWDQSVVYPSTGKKRATVNYSDLEKLDDGEFLNDSIIEFYIRWMHEREKERGNLKNDQVYFFSTYFYSALTAPATGRRGLNYEAVQRWTSKDDIFDHDFVVIPVNEHLHWYLAVVCNLSKIKRKFESELGRRKSAGPPPKKYSPETPAVVIIDSMGVGRSKTIANIKEYLIREADDKRGMTITKDDLQGMNAKVGIPQQENFYDCGVHLCGYVDRLMNDP
ncbi:cysteine proteinase, partial [Tothia fuscella]